jgi:hypothetical protein
MDSKLSRLCDGLLEAGWLVAVIAVPLFFNIHSERVFEPDKLVLMRSIAVFMAGIMLVSLSNFAAGRISNGCNGVMKIPFGEYHLCCLWRCSC